MDIAPGLYCRQSINDSSLYFDVYGGNLKQNATQVQKDAPSPTTGVTQALGAVASDRLIAHSLGTQLNTLVNSSSSKPRTLSHH